SSSQAFLVKDLSKSRPPDSAFAACRASVAESFGAEGPPAEEPESSFLSQPSANRAAHNRAAVPTLRVIRDLSGRRNRGFRKISGSIGGSPGHAILSGGDAARTELTGNRTELTGNRTELARNRTELARNRTELARNRTEQRGRRRSSGCVEGA